MQEKTFTVTEINNYINKKLKMDPNLKNIYEGKSVVTTTPLGTPRSSTGMANSRS